MATTLSPLTSPLLDRPGLRHGFFTRRGGVSGGLYASLNCGPGSKDDPGKVAENRRRVLASLGAPDGALLSLYQVHSADVVTVTAPFADPDRPKADAMVTAVPNLALGILTADCAPVLFADAEAGVVGAAHAGWKGAVSGVVEATVAAMEALGARRGRIAAAIGPCIAQGSYEVGPEFPAPFLDLDAGNGRFFAPAPGAAGGAEKSHFDLAGFVLQQLAAAGIGAARWVGRDTRMEEEDFFSYRRTCLRGEGDYGRQISAIMLANQD